MSEETLKLLIGSDAPTIVIITLLYLIHKSSEKSSTLLSKILDQLKQYKK